jgi:hypothetical protein
METAIAREVEVESHGEKRMSRPTPALRQPERSSDALRSADERPVVAMARPPRGESERRSAVVLPDGASENEDTTVVLKVRPRKAPLSLEEDAIESEPDLRVQSEDGANKRTSAKAPALALPRDESFDREQRGLVLPPNLPSELTAQMKNAAWAMGVGPGTPARERAGSTLPAPAIAAEPSVQVTIGRIEVRAVSERGSKPAGRSRPASPVMSLEEYLHRCAQRGGR